MRRVFFILTTLAIFGGLAFSEKSYKQGDNMANQNKVLVAYFSATGTTAGIAKAVADGCGGTLCEIKPTQPYTDADLDWHDKNSRTTKECNDKSSRPSIKPLSVNIAEYDTVFVGFPIWWGRAPAIIQTFLESADFTGKQVALFCTSGSSGLGNTQSILKKSAAGAAWVGGKRLASGDTKGAASWARQIISK